MHSIGQTKITDTRPDLL